MRNELIDLYNLAKENYADKDIVEAYQRAKYRIGPQIAIHEVLENDSLRARVAALEAELVSPRVVVAMELAELLAWQEEVEEFISNVQFEGKTIKGSDLVKILNQAEYLIYDAEVRVRRLFK